MWEKEPRSLFLVSPNPILGGANEKLDIGAVCGRSVRASGRLILEGPQEAVKGLYQARVSRIYPSDGANLNVEQACVSIFPVPLANAIVFR